ncbi:MAG TPA: SDR family NAD(P)-dependent oxidoreductase [Candidatus Angelobacter sp.]|jgi:acyl transferase domain-containing protein/acyl carrier protein|nr:SDR family NAD(P)-dependent oxidoreductase [Candidatus Angelobacter sp.]
MSRAAESATAIAIIGMSGRFPGAGDLEQFWANLCGGVESIRAFTPEELAAAGVDSISQSSPQFVNAGAPLDGAEMFDASFFGFTAREAESMDPQQRVFLECAWHALEDAAHPVAVDIPIGIFAGMSTSSYLYRLYAHPEIVEAVGNYQIMIGNDKDHLATQVAYKLNLRGPALSIQTACSTSLVAVSLACQSLLNHECDVALAGGASVKLPQHGGYFYENGGILSPDGHCRPFDADAKGTVAGNGAGIVVLKRMSDAVRDRNRIRAVILGSAINNDGAGKVGYTAPSVNGQTAVIAAALAFANVSADTIGYVEAHGTATPMGDPIEIKALTQAFRAGTQRKSFCSIGSVKSNIGHLDAAAGIAGLIKAVLCLENRQLPPSLHFAHPNPEIDFKASPFYVQSQLTEWKPGATRRRAAVSSFGIGGTNAHAVLEEAPPAESSGPSRKVQVLPISARSEAALDHATANLLENLRKHPQRPLADVAFTLSVARTGFAQRRFLLARSTEEAIALLSDGQLNAAQLTDGQFADTPRLRTGKIEENPQVAFLFPGQGTQHAGMARELYEEEIIFRTEVDRCAEMLRRHMETDILEVLYGSDANDDRLQQTELAQPALFIIEYALAQLLISWGIVPKAMLGHSLGEYVAACLAGVFSLEDALAIVAARGRLMQRTAGGSMLAASLPEAEAFKFLNNELSLAAVNGATQCVFSGGAAAVAHLDELLREQEKQGSRIHTSRAFHSASMDSILDEFRDRLKKVAMKPPVIPYFSNLTGTWQTAAAADPNYWVQHLRRTVRFADAASELCQSGFQICVEVGPGNTLGALLQPCLRAAGGGIAIPSLPRVNEPVTDTECIAKALGEVWLAGGTVSWNDYYSGERRQRVALPGYRFERRRYSVDLPAAPALPVVARNPDIGMWFYLPSWRQTPPPIQVELKGSYVVFVDAMGLGEKVAAQLRAADCPVTTVEAGEKFIQYNNQHFAIRPNSPEDHAELLRIVSAGGMPQKFLHLWNVSASASAPGCGFHSLLNFAQALCSRHGPLDVLVVSSNMQSVTGEEPVHAEKATVLGLCRVLPLEHPNIRCRSLDISWPGLNAAEQVLAESTVEGDDLLIAYRGGRRWVETVEYTPLPVSVEPPLRQRGVYLITGGFGGIGLTLAGHLAYEYQARIVLVGRHIPAEDLQVLQQIRAMEEAGAELMLCAADVCDHHSMQVALVKIHARFGHLHGVIHAAGVAGGGLIEIKQQAAAEQVLAPKVTGTLVLDELLRNEPLDFFVCCSSLASVLGGFGQSDYCGANSFLDAYAQGEAPRRNRLTVSINWDTWAEAGMAVKTVVPAEMEGLRAEALKNGMLSLEGVSVFRRALAARVPQLCISTLPLHLRIEQGRRPAQAMTAADQAVAIPDKARHPRPKLRSQFVAPSTAIERSVAAIWETLLGIEKVGVHDNFLELGGHSLLAIQLVSRTRSEFGVELAVREIFETPTIAGLANSIERGMNERRKLARLVADLEQLSEDEVKAQLSQKGE